MHQLDSDLHLHDLKSDQQNDSPEERFQGRTTVFTRPGVIHPPSAVEWTYHSPVSQRGVSRALRELNAATSATFGSSNDTLMFSKCIYDKPYHSFSGPRRMMTRGLKWGVLVGLIAGVIAIVLVGISGIRGPLGGLIAAGATGVVIWIVSHRIDRPRDGSRDR